MFGRRDKIRPLQPGTSIGPVDGSAGTVTAIVRKRYGGGKPFILSAEHVLFGLEAQPRAIAQPAAPDAPALSKYHIVAKAYERIGLNIFTANYVDAALAELEPTVDGDNTVYGSNLRLFRTDIVRELASVVMHGRTSGAQPGQVKSVDAAIRLPVEIDHITQHLEFHSIATANYRCAEGDSGGPVIDPQSGALVGLHFGWVDNLACFCHIQTIFDALQLELI